MQWCIELNKFGVQYQPKLLIKAQLLVGFIVECSYEDQSAKENETGWKLYVDEASNRGAKGIGIILKRPNGVTIKCALNLAFKAINNMPKYRTLFKDLELVRKMKPKKLNMYNDS